MLILGPMKSGAGETANETPISKVFVPSDMETVPVYVPMLRPVALSAIEKLPVCSAFTVPELVGVIHD